MGRRQKDYPIKLVDHLYNQIPAFTDLFTEETFYMTVVGVVLSTFIVVFIVSRYVTIKPVE